MKNSSSNPCKGGRARRLGYAALGAGLVAALGYAALVGAAWSRYGRAEEGRTEPGDNRGGGGPLLDRFLPHYDVLERHEVRVAAPVEDTFAAARALDVNRSGIVRAVFRARELAMGAFDAPAAPPPKPLLEQTLEMGWGVLAEEPGREIVVGAVTRPWEADVRFRGLPPEEFAAFADPGFVRIAWNLAAEPVGPSESVFRTETRAVATDADARRRFRRYWSFVSPGVLLIRLLSLRLVRADAERRHRQRTAALGRDGSKTR